MVYFSTLLAKALEMLQSVTLYAPAFVIVVSAISMFFFLLFFFFTQVKGENLYCAQLFLIRTSAVWNEKECWLVHSSASAQLFERLNDWVYKG